MPEFPITWKEETEDHPVVIRYNGSNSKSLIIERWKQILLKLSGSEPDDKSRQITIRITNTNAAFLATIYENATVMFQGKGFVRWLQHYSKDIIEALNIESSEMPPKKPGSKKKTGLPQLKTKT